MAPLGLLRHRRGIGAIQVAVLLAVQQILRIPPALLHGPERAAPKHGLNTIGIETPSPATARARCNRGRQGFGQGDPPLHHLGALEVGEQATHTARHVNASTRRRHHPTFSVVKGRHNANRKAITPMGIGHQAHRANNPGPSGHGAGLLTNARVHAPQQGLTGQGHHRS
jgi:hypothetical protein